MLLGFCMPAVNNITLAGGTWLTEGGWLPLVDGRPTRAARIQRAGAVTLAVSLASDIVPGVIALLGLNVPAGTAIEAAGANGVAHALPDGSVAAYLLPTGNAATSSVAITIAGAGMLEIGEVVVMRRQAFEIEPEWSTDLVDPTESSRSNGAQLATRPATPYRRFEARLRAQGEAQRAAWEAARMALSRDKRAVVFARHSSAAELHVHALYGVARVAAIAHGGGNWFTTSIAADEVPALS